MALALAQNGMEMSVRVLIVDDQAPFRMAARLVVESTDGFDVVGEAESGEDSVEMARELRPDLVLMDVNMPGIDGLEATRRILHEVSPTIVVVLSTYTEEEYGDRAREAGAAAYITKSSFSPDALEEAWSAARAEPATALPYNVEGSASTTRTPPFPEIVEDPSSD